MARVKTRCRHRHHAGHLAHRCPGVDGMVVCCECVEMLDCRCISRKRLYKAAMRAAERLRGERSWWRKLFGVMPKKR